MTLRKFIGYLAGWLGSSLTLGWAWSQTPARLDGLNAIGFVLSLGVLHALALYLARLSLPSQGTGRLSRMALYAQVILVGALLHKLLLSPFLIAPLRSDSLASIYCILMFALLAYIDPLDPGVPARPKSKRAASVGPRLDGVRLPRRFGFSFVCLLVVLLALGARRSGWQARYRDQVLRLWAGYPATEVASKLWGFEVLAPGLEFSWPMGVIEDPDEGSVVYVLERAGLVQRVDLSVVPPSKHTLLDLRSKVGKIEGELGALGMAFHPAASSWTDSPFQFLYVYYTAQDEHGLSDRLSRFSVDWSTQSINPSSELVLIDQADRDFWHNGGGLAFGLDGYLYLGMGDEGGANADIFGNSQCISNNLFSGVLRIDVDRLGGAQSHAIPKQPSAGRTASYHIPNDNPFVGVAEALGEFWAIGLRNPSRLAFDPLTGELWVSDVGGSLYEELNVVRRGSNLGWSYREGPRRLAADPLSLLGTPTDPRLSYEHDGFRVCAIGGAVYRGSKHPELEGAYLYADYGSGEVFAVRSKNGRTIGHKSLSAPLVNLSLQISSLQVVHDEILVTSLAHGQVYRLVPKDASSRASMRTGMGPGESFQVLCARCHGDAGVPQAAAAEEAQRAARNFADPLWQDSVDDQHIMRVIREGGAVLRPDSAMPAWGEALDDELIIELVALIRSFGVQTPPARQAAQAGETPATLDSK